MPYGQADRVELSDAELLAAVRDGDTARYAVLYQRHQQAALGHARHLVRSRTEADDLTSEAFTRVLNALVTGGGPTEAFRPYLLTTQRRIAYRKYAGDGKVLPYDDLTLFAADDLPADDPVIAGLDRSLVARAFEHLPERWQLVLWHTVIDGETPAAVAPLLDMTPNGVSALAYRAREGLRQAYLQVHINQRSLDPNCRTTAESLGAYVRDVLSPRNADAVQAHLSQCDRCQTIVSELNHVNASLSAMLGPTVFGAAVASRAQGVTTAIAPHHLVPALAHWLRRHLPAVATAAATLCVTLVAVVVLLWPF